MATDRCLHGQPPGCQSVSPAPQRWSRTRVRLLEWTRALGQSRRWYWFC